MICVYESTCTDFSANGLGTVSPSTCTVTETLNGEWELMMIHPLDTFGKWTRLQEGRILRAPVPASVTPRVNQIVKDGAETMIYKVNTSGGNLHLRSGTGTSYKILGNH